MDMNINGEFAFCIKKFAVGDYATWKFHLKSVLNTKKVIHCLNDVIVPTEAKAQEAWEGNNALAKSIIIACIADSHLSYIQGDDIKTAKLMIGALNKVFEKQTICTRLFLRKKLFNLKMGSDESLQQLFVRFDDIVRQIQASGGKIDKLDEICHLFMTLPSKFDNVVTALETVSEDRLKMDYVKSRLIEEDIKASNSSSFPSDNLSAFHTFCGKKANVGGKSLPFQESTSYGKGEKSTSNGNSTQCGGEKQMYRSSIQCFKCGKYGHKADRCYSKRSAPRSNFS